MVCCTGWHQVLTRCVYVFVCLFVCLFVWVGTCRCMGMGVCGSFWVLYIIHCTTEESKFLGNLSFSCSFSSSRYSWSQQHQGQWLHEHSPPLTGSCASLHQLPLIRTQLPAHYSSSWRPDLHPGCVPLCVIVEYVCLSVCLYCTCIMCMSVYSTY